MTSSISLTPDLSTNNFIKFNNSKIYWTDLGDNSKYIKLINSGSEYTFTPNENIPSTLAIIGGGGAGNIQGGGGGGAGGAYLSADDEFIFKANYTYKLKVGKGGSMINDYLAELGTQHMGLIVKQYNYATVSNTACYDNVAFNANDANSDKMIASSGNIINFNDINVATNDLILPNSHSMPNDITNTCEWLGYFYVPEGQSGSYQFKIDTSKTAYMWLDVDGSMSTITNPTTANAKCAVSCSVVKYDTTTTFNLTENTFYPVRIIYAEKPKPTTILATAEKKKEEQDLTCTDKNILIDYNSSRFISQPASSFYKYGTSCSISDTFTVISSPIDNINGIIGAGAVYLTFNDTTKKDIIKFTSTSSSYYGYFGYSCAIYQNTLIIGAYGETVNKKANAGAVYIFTYTTTWDTANPIKLVSRTPTENGYFGYSCDIYGNNIIVGAYGENKNKGNAYVFTYTTTWQVKPIKLVSTSPTSNGFFGCSCAIHGNNIIIGACGETNGRVRYAGAAYVFTYIKSWRVKPNRLLSTTPILYGYFGYSCAIYDTTILIGAYGETSNGNVNAGAAYIFTYNKTWKVKPTKLIANNPTTNDLFGISCAIYDKTIMIMSKVMPPITKLPALTTSAVSSTPSTSTTTTTSAGTTTTIITTITTPSDSKTTSTSSKAASETPTALVCDKNSIIIDNNSNRLISQPSSSFYQFATSCGISDNLVVIGSPIETVNGITNAGVVYIIDNSTEQVVQIQLNSSSPIKNGYFGYSCAIYGNNIVIGAYGETVNKKTFAGAVYVFTYTTTWNTSSPIKLVSPSPTKNGCFGFSCAIYENNIVVGAYGENSNKGNAYVFSYTNTWSVVPVKLTSTSPSTNGFFGCSCGIYGDNIIIGAYGENGYGIKYSGAAYIFTYNKTWKVSPIKLISSHPIVYGYFGYSCAICSTTVVVGAYGETTSGYINAGAAYIFKYNGKWQINPIRLIADKPKNNDLFGISCAIYGDTIIVMSEIGGPPGTVNKKSSTSSLITANLPVDLTCKNDNILIDYNSSRFISQPLSTFYQFSTSCAISDNFNIVSSPIQTINGVNACGAVYVSDNSNNSKVQLVSSTPNANGYFGFSCAIYGNNIIIGAYGETVKGRKFAGAVYLFKYTNNSWDVKPLRLISNKPAKNACFGFSCAIFENNIIIGAIGESVNNKTNAGAAYVFSYDTKTWKLNLRLVSGLPTSNGNFGCSCSIYAYNILIGAYGETSNNVINAGAAYIFTYAHTWKVNPIRLISSSSSEYGYFGYSCSIYDTNVLIGAFGETTKGYLNAGAAYVFTYANTWKVNPKRLISNNPFNNELFGISCVVNQSKIVIMSQISPLTTPLPSATSTATAAKEQQTSFSLSMKGPTTNGRFISDFANYFYSSKPSNTSYKYIKSTESYIKEYDQSGNLTNHIICYGGSPGNLANTCLNVPVWGMYFAEDWDASTMNLKDSSDNNKDASTTGNITINTDPDNNFSYLSGNSDCSIRFPNGSIPSNYTICCILKGQILSGTNTNWDIKLNEDDGWNRICINNNTMLINSSNHKQSNTNNIIDNLIINGNSWSAAFIIIWDSILTDNQLQYIDSLMIDYLNGIPIKQNFINNDSNRGGASGTVDHTYNTPIMFVNTSKNTGGKGNISIVNNILNYYLKTTNKFINTNNIDNTDNTSATDYINTCNGDSINIDYNSNRFISQPSSTFYKFGTSCAISDNFNIVSSPIETVNNLKGAGAVFVSLNDTSQIDQLKLTSISPTKNGYFGFSCAIYGNTIVIGAYGESGNGYSYSGAAYIFTYENDLWNVDNPVKLVSNTSGSNGYFGYSCAIYENTVVIGACGEDRVYVFTKTNTWQVNPIVLKSTSNYKKTFFGSSCAIYGNTIVVGAFKENSGSGSAYVFTKTTSWQVKPIKLKSKLSISNGYFGYSCAIYDTTILIGACGEKVSGYVNAGAAYVFSYTTTWKVSPVRLISNDPRKNNLFGISCSIDQGKIIIIEQISPSITSLPKTEVRESFSNYSLLGSLKDTLLNTFKSLTASTADICANNIFIDYNETRTISQLPTDFYQFGTSCSVNEKFNIISYPNEKNGVGAVYISSNDPSITEKIKLIPKSAIKNSYFGFSCAIYENTLVIGAYGETINKKKYAGVVYIYTYTNSWNVNNPIKLTSKSISTNGYFGYSCAIYKNTIVIGARGENNNKGSAYIFSYNNTWKVKPIKLVSGFPVVNGYFGCSCAIHNNNIVIGAYGEAAYGIRNVGAAYVFRYSNSWNLKPTRLISTFNFKNGYFGYSCAIYDTNIVIGAFGETVNDFKNAGAAYVFNYNNTWQVDPIRLISNEPVDNDLFGVSCAINENGIVIINKISPGKLSPEASEALQYNFNCKTDAGGGGGGGIKINGYDYNSILSIPGKGGDGFALSFNNNIIKYGVGGNGSSFSGYSKTTILTKNTGSGSDGGININSTRASDGAIIIRVKQTQFLSFSINNTNKEMLLQIYNILIVDQGNLFDFFQSNDKIQSYLNDSFLNSYGDNFSIINSLGSTDEAELSHISRFTNIIKILNNIYFIIYNLLTNISIYNKFTINEIIITKTEKSSIDLNSNKIYLNASDIIPYESFSINNLPFSSNGSVIIDGNNLNMPYNIKKSDITGSINTIYNDYLKTEKKFLINNFYNIFNLDSNNLIYSVYYYYIFYNIISFNLQLIKCINPVFDYNKITTLNAVVEKYANNVVILPNDSSIELLNKQKEKYLINKNESNQIDEKLKLNNLQENTKLSDYSSFYNINSIFKNSIIINIVVLFVILTIVKIIISLSNYTNDQKISMLVILLIVVIIITFCIYYYYSRNVSLENFNVEEMNRDMSLIFTYCDLINLYLNNIILKIPNINNKDYIEDAYNVAIFNNEKKLEKLKQKNMQIKEFGRSKDIMKLDNMSYLKTLLYNNISIIIGIICLILYFLYPKMLYGLIIFYIIINIIIFYYYYISNEKYVRNDSKKRYNKKN